MGILIFVENQLTVLHVNKPEHKLKKEVGYHFDLVMVGVLAAICGLFGMPWMSAASVRSLQHLQALSVFSKRNAPGEKPKLEFVHEQRITNIAIHFLISECSSHFLILLFCVGLVPRPPSPDLNCSFGFSVI